MGFPDPSVDTGLAGPMPRAGSFTEPWTGALMRAAHSVCPEWHLPPSCASPCEIGGPPQEPTHFLFGVPKALIPPLGVPNAGCP